MDFQKEERRRRPRYQGFCHRIVAAEVAALVWAGVQYIERMSSPCWTCWAEEAGYALDHLFVPRLIDLCKNLDTVFCYQNDFVPLTGRGIERSSNSLEDVIDRKELTGAARGAGGPHPVTVMLLCGDGSPKIDSGSKIADDVDTPADGEESSLI